MLEREARARVVSTSQVDVGSNEAASRAGRAEPLPRERSRSLDPAAIRTTRVASS